MTVQIIKSDLFEVKADAYAHGVNCVGKMGKGIALEFKKRWPEMYTKYQAWCKKRAIYVGEYGFIGEKMFYKGDGIVIANLFIQGKAMSNCAKYWAIEKSLIEFAYWLGTKWTMGNIADDYKSIKSIAMPYIGCGIGGLHKDGVEAIVRHVFDDWDGIVYICEWEASHEPLA